MSFSTPGLPAVIERAGDLLCAYDVVVCDVWGVVHDGETAYVAAGEALSRFRSRGGTVVLLSNAPLPSSRVGELLDDKHVRREAWDVIVTSGDITQAHVAAARYETVHHIGPDRDLALFEKMQARRAQLADADAIVVTGLIDDRNETAASYGPTLEQALARKLELVCANPDLIVDVGGTLLPCAGVVAALYEDMGGPVYWAGKPYAPAYEMALAAARRIRDSAIDRSRVLAIGDALRTDIAGAAAYGLDALFVGQGIHREEVMPGGRIDPERVAALFAAVPARPIAAIGELIW